MKKIIIFIILLIPYTNYCIYTITIENTTEKPVKAFLWIDTADITGAHHKIVKPEGKESDAAIARRRAGLLPNPEDDINIIQPGAKKKYITHACIVGAAIGPIAMSLHKNKPLAPYYYDEWSSIAACGDHEFVWSGNLLQDRNVYEIVEQVQSKAKKTVQKLYDILSELEFEDTENYISLDIFSNTQNYFNELNGYLTTPNYIAKNINEIVKKIFAFKKSLNTAIYTEESAQKSQKKLLEIFDQLITEVKKVTQVYNQKVAWLKNPKNKKQGLTWGKYRYELYNTTNQGINVSFGYSPTGAQHKFVFPQKSFIVKSDKCLKNITVNNTNKNVKKVCGNIKITWTDSGFGQLGVESGMKKRKRKRKRSF